jgi:anti-anti-sigma factor
MNVNVQEQVVRTVVVAPMEELDAFTASDFRQTLEMFWQQGAVNFVIDLSNTPALDSAGVAVLVQLYKRCRQHGGSTRFVWPKAESVRRILRLTHFDRIFDMVEYSAV